MAIFHGTTDAVVAHGNANELVKQWCNINGADINPDIHNSAFQNNSIVDQKVYLMPNNTDTAVVQYDFSNIGHVIPIDEGTGPMQGGTPGDYTQDINFNSTYWVADFFNLIPSVSNTIKEETNKYSIQISNINQQSFKISIDQIQNITFYIHDFNGRLIQQGGLDYSTQINLITPLHLGIISIKDKGNTIYSKKIIFE